VPHTIVMQNEIGVFYKTAKQKETKAVFHPNLCFFRICSLDLSQS